MASEGGKKEGEGSGTCLGSLRPELQWTPAGWKPALPVGTKNENPPDERDERRRPKIGEKAKGDVSGKRLIPGGILS